MDDWGAPQFWNPVYVDGGWKQQVPALQESTDIQITGETPMMNAEILQQKRNPSKKHALSLENGDCKP